MGHEQAQMTYHSILLTMVFYNFLCNNNGITKFFKNAFYSII